MFPKAMWPTMIGKETFISCGICLENCSAFLWLLHTEPSFMHLSIQDLSSHVIMNGEYAFVNSHVPQYGHTFVSKASYSLQNRIVMWKHSSTQKCSLIFFSTLTKQPTRWAICALMYMVSYMKLLRDLFLGLTKWEQLHHRYLQQCSQPTYASSKLLQGHSVPEIRFKE